MFYDFSNYQSIEDIEDLNILHTQLLSTIKKHVIEPYVGIYLIGSFCFNINNSNDIDIMYCTPKKYKRIHLKTFEYNKLLTNIFNKKIQLFFRTQPTFFSFMEKISNPPHFDLINLKWINKNHGDIFNKKLKKGKWVKRIM